METTISKSVNYLKHKISHYDETENRLYKIDIRLSDDCKNGHNDFAITGAIYKGKLGVDSESIIMGACGDKLAAKFPELKIFNDLHLSDVNGVPMSAISNGFYHLKTKPEIAREYIRATEIEWETIKTAEDEQVFQYHVEALGIIKRWKTEAQTAIRILEQFTGQTFKDDSTRLHYKPLTKAQKLEIEKRITEGYYNADQIETRRKAKLQEQKTKQAEKFLSERNAHIQKANIEYAVDMAVLNADLGDNYIYYNHTNELCFNWRDDQYHRNITDQQLEQFKKDVDYGVLPIGITIKMATRKT